MTAFTEDEQAGVVDVRIAEQHCWPPPANDPDQRPAQRVRWIASLEVAGSTEVRLGWPLTTARGQAIHGGGDRRGERERDDEREEGRDRTMWLHEARPERFEIDRKHERGEQDEPDDTSR